MTGVCAVRTFSGSRHTGYLMTNDAGALAVVREGKRGGWFVHAGPVLIHTDRMLDAYDIAVQELAA